MTTSFWQQAEQGPGLSCDIAVVGGGIIGTSTAYWLKKTKPEWNVVLLESRTVGYGASGRNAGFLLQGTASNFATDIQTYGEDTAWQLWHFTLENRNLIEAEFQADRINLVGSGCLIAAGSEREHAELQHSATLLEQAGIPVAYWAAEELPARIGAAHFHGALYVPSGGSMNPMKLLREMSGKSGALILEQHPVTALSHINDGCLLHTPHRIIQAERVFLALNAYLPKLLPESAPYIKPVRAQMLASPPQPVHLPYPLYSHDGYYYMRQAPDGAMLLGGARHLFREEEVGYGDTTTPHLQQALLDYYTHHFGNTIPVQSQWSGTMALTPDGLPLLAPLPDLPGSYWAAGFNGHGMGYGFHFGKMVAEGYASGRLESLFDLGRLIDV